MPPRSLDKESAVAWINFRQAIIVAFITAAATIGTTVLTLAPREQSEYEIVGDRAHTLAGTWTGTYNQPFGLGGNPIVDSPLRLTLHAGKKLIKGTGTLDVTRPDGTVFHLDVTFHGGFLHNRFLRLEYENSDSAALQFGSLIAELSSDGKTISGNYVGFGAQTQRIVYGTATLRKW